MLYDEFRNQLQEALLEVGLVWEHMGSSIETIDLSNSGRHWKVSIWPNAPE
jgi:hypothetical protein